MPQTMSTPARTRPPKLLASTVVEELKRAIQDLLVVKFSQARHFISGPVSPQFDIATGWRSQPLI